MKKIVNWVKNHLWVEKGPTIGVKYSFPIVTDKDYYVNTDLILNKLNKFNVAYHINSGLKRGVPSLHFSLIDFATIKMLNKAGFKCQRNSFSFYLEETKTKSEIVKIWESLLVDLLDNESNSPSIT